MQRHSGTIQVISSPSGKTLVLTKPNPTPPPATLDVVIIDNPPAWLWEIAVGNAGRPMTLDVDDQTPPAPIRASVS